METWENLQARLFHLSYLAEELPRFVARPPAAWLYRQIAREADAVARIAADYVAEAERAKLTNPPQPTGCDPVTDAITEETATAATSPSSGGGAL